MSMDVTTQLRRLGASDDMIAASLCNGRPITELDWTTSNTVTGGRFGSAGVLRIVVPGPAPGKPRMTRRDVWAKRPAVVRYREWCDLVRSIAGDVPAAESVAQLRFIAYYEPPKSWPKKKRCAAIGTPHRARPDLDNSCKGLLDILWPDNDSGVANIVMRKEWAWSSRVEIEIVLNGVAK